jgi:drug/metabolite transporter (DMT)-like permease
MPSVRAASTMPGAPSSSRDETRGLILGFAAVVMFALTLPMTRLAVGTVEAPQLPPLFVTAGRAAVAGLLAAVYLAVTRASWPARSLRSLPPVGAGPLWGGPAAGRPARVHAASLAWCALGTVVGFPLFLALALRHVPAAHGAVITGVLPLATAVAAALLFRQRPSAGFWLCAVAGCALVLGFAAWRGGGALHMADALLLAAVASAALGYVHGAKLARAMTAEQVIGWVLVLSLPLTLPAALATLPSLSALAQVRASAWAGFGYVSLVSMWLGFFAWYRALALGGTVRVSQVQLVQPFLSLLFAVPLLGEPLDAVTVAFALAVVATVFVGRRMPAGAPAPARVDAGAQASSNSPGASR